LIKKKDKIEKNIKKIRGAISARFKSVKMAIKRWYLANPI